MQENYANHNSDLILWIYEKDEWREVLLRDWVVERLINSKAEGKKAMRATCKDSLKAINRNNNNCPILMDKMTFNIFSNYISMKKGKKSGVYIYATSYGDIHSALTHL